MKGIGVLVIALLVYTVSCTGESEKHGNPARSDHYKDGEHDDDYDHEAILGSEDDAEEYSHLPPEEAKERLGELFVKMDANQDGHLDVQELTKWIKNSFAKLNLEDTRTKMKTDDKDGDGFVTWDEFTVTTYGMTEEELKDYQEQDVENPESKKQMAMSLDYDKKKFAAADENGDGKLDDEEATAFLHPYDYSRMADVETDRVLGEYDTNKDGKITVDEYLSSKTFSQMEEEELIGEKENFKHNDINSDGALDRKEIMKWVSPDIESLASDEATHLMGETDTNKDGQLTSDEVKEQHDLWVGSEATDYGEMLHDEL